MARSSRTTWLDEGLTLLQQSGIDQVRIDTLCTRLKLTKGSFYHHFKNHQAYMEALLEHWEEKYTSRFIDYAEQGETAANKLERLNHMTLTAYSDPEVHIRAWALTDAVAKQTVQRVDERRVNYLINLYTQYGMTEAQAKVVSNTIYATLIGTQYLLVQLTPKDVGDMFNYISQINSNTEQGDTS